MGVAHISQKGLYYQAYFNREKCVAESYLSTSLDRDIPLELLLVKSVLFTRILYKNMF
jgi:hypothetical protein